MFSFSRPFLHHQPQIVPHPPPGRIGGLVDDVAQIVQAPGLLRAASASQASRALPPFQARVVKPRISTFTPQRSSVRASTSAQIAAMEIGRPRIEPGIVQKERDHGIAELVSFSTLKD
jgi:hypothetical protein